MEEHSVQPVGRWLRTDQIVLLQVTVMMFWDLQLWVLEDTDSARPRDMRHVDAERAGQGCPL